VEGNFVYLLRIRDLVIIDCVRNTIVDCCVYKLKAMYSVTILGYQKN
jgi:hypothetical protein